MAGYSLESPKTVLRQPIPNIDSFYYRVFPYLFTAYAAWRDIVFLIAPPPIILALKNSPAYEGLETLACGLFKLTGYPLSIIELTKRFPSQIYGYSIPQTPKETEEILLAWWTLMNRKEAWALTIPNQPQIIDLRDISPLIVARLPKKMILGGYPMIRIMDSVYVPDYYGADWSEALFEFLGPENYERMADLLLKEKIDEILLDKAKGNIFDIGCGSGLLQHWVNSWGKQREISLFGIDLSAKMIKKAQERGEPAIVGNAASLSSKEILAEFEKIGQPINFFDHAVMSYVDNWLTPEERKSIFRTVFQLLDCGGSLRLNVYSLEPGWQDHYRNLALEVGFKKVLIFEKTLPSRDGNRRVGFVFAYK
ncbi:MAG: methyltransferase domain-containing protein [Microgenomates group bacterium]|nr:methyltransferase domain-containing protein [Microgenomates group bacterium]